MAYGLLILYVLVVFIHPQEWIPGMESIPFMPFLMGITVFATLLEMPNKKWRLKDAPENTLVLVFFVAVLLSNVLSFQSWFNFGATKAAFTGFGKIILLYFLISINLRSVRQVKGLVAAVIIAALFMAVNGILEIQTGYGFGHREPLFIPQEGAFRIVAFGFFDDPNDVAQGLVVALPFLISGIHRPGVSVIRRMVCLVLACVVSYGVYLTGSRGGWLALAVMLISYFLLNFRTKKVGFVLGVLALVGLMTFAPARVATESTHDESAHGRIVAWADGNKMLKMSPIFGVGKGRFADYSESGKVAHNSFVHCWGELGLFGYFWWLGMVIACVKDSYALGKDPITGDHEKDEMRRLGRVLLAGWIGYLAAAVFLSRTYKPELYLLVGMVAAMRAIREREGGPLPRAFVKRDYRWVLLAELTSIPFFYVMMRFMW